jgi:very-short-patch-repair endonuclease
MAPKNVQGHAWALARRQHGLVTREQLLELGFSDEAIKHRLRVGRLHRVWRGVYAVGRPELTRRATWMAATLTCNGVLSHSSAAALWEIRPDVAGPIEVTVAAHRRCRTKGLTVHRRRAFEATRRFNIPVTSALQTLIDLSYTLEAKDDIEAAVNEADKRHLIRADALRKALDGRRDGARLRKLLDRRTFVLTDSRLERRFMPIVRAIGLQKPLTRTFVNGYKVDFYWPDLKLVIETDGLTYHRTAAQQAEDRVRDQVHAAAGLTPLRFTHAQIEFERPHVRKTLEAVAARLG